MLARLIAVNYVYVADLTSNYSKLRSQAETETLSYCPLMYICTTELEAEPY